jgi:hypothetical protein
MDLIGSPPARMAEAQTNVQADKLLAFAAVGFARAKLFFPKRYGRIELGGPPGGYSTGSQADRNQDGRCRSEGEGIVRSQAIEEARNRLG